MSDPNNQSVSAPTFSEESTKVKYDPLEELMKERVYDAADPWEAVETLKREILLRVEKYNTENNK